MSCGSILLYALGLYYPILLLGGKRPYCGGAAELKIIA
jgi:hypothetical protein